MYFPLVLHNVDVGINSNWFKSVAQLYQNFLALLCSCKKNSNQNRVICPSRGRSRDGDKGQDLGEQICVPSRFFFGDWLVKRKQPGVLMNVGQSTKGRGMSERTRFSISWSFCPPINFHIYALKSYSWVLPTICSSLQITVLQDHL